MTDINRRDVLKSGVLLAAAVTGAGNAKANPGRQPFPYENVYEETKSLAQLYEDAKQEGGKLIVYGGGDTPTQQDGTKQAFLAQFRTSS